MGNKYRVMANIELTCRLHTRPGRHDIQVNTGDDVNVFIEKVKREATFTNLALAEGDNLTKFTEGELNRFWGGDLGLPSEEHTFETEEGWRVAEYR
ncbi:hypothetical protein C1645_819375 [Glomus cerebriforme]|uniref:Uncharacterized protein n=1 Tax=Glomus cerebriforme TaxID=658196 RepID=A0A397T5F7_9GLOM|nr:hypothetical protein C1645_819375 [Glomus cerebriforme]